MNASHATDLLGAYALGCLEAEEMERVARHLASCPPCQAELRAYQAVVEDLPLAVPQQTPPARLKRAVLQRAAGSTTPSAQTGLLEQIRGLFRPVQPAWAVIGLVLILILAAGNIFLWQQVQQRSAQQTAAFTTVLMKSPAASGQATAMLVISDGGEYGTLIADGLGQLNSGSQYQLWLVKNGQRTSGGVFSVNAEGYGALMVSSKAPLVSYDSFGVTIEPEGGSPGPTGPKVLGGGF